MQLPIVKRKSQGHVGPRTIPVVKMYSSQPFPKSGNQRRAHSIDPEVSDRGKCQQSESFSFSRFSKRQASIFLAFTNLLFMLRLVLNSNSFICSFCTTLWIFIIMGICRYMEICILLKIFPASVILHKALHITHIWSYILACSCTIITFIACYQSTVHFQFFYAGGRNSFRNHPPFILERLVC